VEIVWHGHSFFEVRTANGKTILVDPFDENGLTRVRAPNLRPDLVLVTHGHGDHVGSTVQVNRPTVANFEIGTWLERQGVDEVVTMNTGGFFRGLDGVKIWMAPALHSSGIHTDGGFLGYGGSANGFVIDDGETRFYHSGDTGLFGDMRTVIRDVLKPDVAALPIGDLFTMGAEHAAVAVEWLGVGAAIPMHYNTFPPIAVDPKEFARNVGARARVVVPRVDEGVTVRGRAVEGEARAAR
jgi:L-ascorbate metabolism protein UlaG (beta-lactamase superfamily)